MKPYYEESGITLYHGDCREIIPSLAPVDLVLTDLPYGIDLSNHDTTGATDRVPIEVSDYRIVGDGCDSIASFVLEWASDKPTIAFASPKNPWPGMWRQWLVWDKGGAVGGGGDISTCWKFDWELIQVARTPKLNGRRDCSVLRFHIGMHDLHFHPTQKPLSLLRYLIGKASADGKIICDPCCGSGSTLVAAKEQHRRSIGIEIEERYCEIAANRLRQGVLFGVE